MQHKPSKQLGLGRTNKETRRSLLRTAGRAIVAATAAKLGLAQVDVAALYYYKCCTICYAPGGCAGCQSAWTWHCCDDRSNGYGYICGECYSPGYPANGSCNGVWCSFAYQANPNCLR